MSPTDALLVDIGGDTGALVVYAPAALSGAEIEICAVGTPAAHPLHNVVRPRRVGGRVLHAAVFPDLPAGDYVPHGHQAADPAVFTVVGGSVTEVRWAEPQPVGGR